MKRWLSHATVLWLFCAAFKPIFAAGAPAFTMHELAGEYVYGGTIVPTSGRLTLDRAGNFDLVEVSGLPVVREVEPVKPHATLKGDVLTLPRSRSHLGGDGQPSLDTYYPVRWGQRIYVVRTDLLDSFCDSVNSGDEPRQKLWGGFFLLKREHGQSPVYGLPQVPAFYQKHLLIKPLTGKLTEISRDRYSGQVDLGGNDGVWKGMTLYPYIEQGKNSGRWMAKVTEVNPHSCRIEADHCPIHLQGGQPVYSRADP